MRIANIILAVLFGLFAVVQLNDVDPLRWVLIYGSVATLFGFAIFGHFRKIAIIGFAAILSIEFVRLIPEFMNWIQMGAPTITGQMKAEEPHVEFTREFLGLLLGLIGLGFLYYQAARQQLLGSSTES